MQSLGVRADEGEVWSSLFPPVCLGCDRLLNHVDPLALCARCRPQQAALPESLAALGGVHARWSYDGPLGRAVVALKFGHALALAGPLGRLLASDPHLAQDPRGRPTELLIPVPLHWRRRLVRGFDQSEELSRWALSHLTAAGGEAPILARRALRRVRATAPQTELDADERAGNVRGAFAVIDPSRVRGRHIVVVDDVITTGATARSCAAALLDAGAASVRCVALVRAL